MGKKLSENVTPVGLRPSKGIATIWNLAAKKNVEGRRKQYRLYVIEVSDSASVDLYVGQTRRLVENRLRQHQSRLKAQKASRIFRKKRGTAKCLRYDLFEGLPYFTEREVAIKAEGILADVIKTQLKARVDCDALRSRQKKRKTAVQSKKPAAKKQASL